MFPVMTYRKERRSKFLVRWYAISTTCACVWVCAGGVCVCVCVCVICVCGGELPIYVTLSSVDKNLFNTKQVAIKIHMHMKNSTTTTYTQVYLLTRQRGGHHVASTHLMVALSECGRGQLVPARLIIQCLGSLQSNLYIYIHVHQSS